jgi:hypothetical protein
MTDGWVIQREAEVTTAYGYNAGGTKDWRIPRGGDKRAADSQRACTDESLNGR